MTAWVALGREGLFAPGETCALSRDFPLHPCSVQKERSWRDDHERAVEDQGQTRYPGNALCLWKNLFREDQNGQYGHRCDIHEA